MVLLKKNENCRLFRSTVAMLAFVAFITILSSVQSRAQATTEGFTNLPNLAPAATFPGVGVGAIPDGPGTPTACGNDGAPLNITFTVTGITGPPTDIVVGMTFSPAHTWGADVTAVLIAPNGATHTLYGYTGSTTAGGCGDSSDLAGPYNFLDAALAPPSGGWWQAATLATATQPFAAGNYRTTARGGAGAVNPMPPTTINTSLSSVLNANGTWTLRLTDGGSGDTGSVSAASLTLTGSAGPADAPVDFNNDGRTDYAVIRNVGGGANGQVNWFYNLNNSAAPTVAFAWGLALDFFISEDFDNDNRDDIAVWRPGAATVAAFYIFNSATSTVRVEAFGQTGDDPTIVDDYNGDGSADLAVYRAGATAAAQSTWYFRTAANGPVTFVPWGVGGDFPAPGDYDGNGSADFVVQRNNGNGQARFWTRLSTGATSTTVFGTPTDVIVPGDYDGDGKTDIATSRGVSGSIQWQWLSSLNGSIQYRTFGASATDFVAQGDYDGDGRTDVAVWRPSATANQSAFYSLSSISGSAVIFAFGSNGDYPVANYNSH